MNPETQMRVRMARELASKIIIRIKTTQNRQDLISKIRLGLNVEEINNPEFVAETLKQLKTLLPNDTDIQSLELGEFIK